MTANKVKKESIWKVLFGSSDVKDINELEKAEKYADRLLKNLWKEKYEIKTKSKPKRNASAGNVVNENQQIKKDVKKQQIEKEERNR